MIHPIRVRFWFIKWNRLLFSLNILNTVTPFDANNTKLLYMSVIKDNKIEYNIKLSVKCSSSDELLIRGGFSDESSNFVLPDWLDVVKTCN